MKRGILSTVVLLCSCLAVRAQAPATCTVSGTIYNPDSSAAAGATVRLSNVIKNGVLIAPGPFTFTANGSGFVSFNVVRGATAKLYSTVAPFNVVGGVTVQIPDAATADLAGLATVAAVPTTGFVVESADVSVSSGKFGVLDFSASFVVTESPTGEANVSIPGFFSNPMTTLGDVIYGGSSGAATRLAGNATTTRKFLRQVGDGAASAAPAWNTLVAGDLPTHNHAAADVNSGVLLVTRGGTASGSALNNGRVMISLSGAIVERGALTPSALVVGDGTNGVAPFSFGSANQVVGMNSGGSANEYKSLAVGTSGTDFAIVHAANSITLNLPDASTTARGAVSTGTQSISGDKTLLSKFILSSNSQLFTWASASAEDLSQPQSMGRAPLLIETQFSYTSATVFKSVGVGVRPSFGATTGGEGIFWTPINVKVGHSGTPIPSGTKGQLSAYEANLDTSQVLADLTANESGHAFGATLVARGGAPMSVMDAAFTINTTAPSSEPGIRGINISFTNNVAGGLIYGVFMQQAGANAGTAAFRATGSWGYGFDYRGSTFSSGGGRLPNASWMVWRNAADSADLNVIRVNASNVREVGGDLVIGGALSLGTNPAATGLFRLPNDGTVVARNAANNGDISLFKLNTSNEFEMLLNVINNAANPFFQVGSSSTGWLFQKVDSDNRLRFFKHGTGEFLAITAGGRLDLVDPTNAAITFPEISTTPGSPASGTEARLYLKADKLIVVYNNAGTVRYKYLDLTGTGVTWTHTTTAP